MRQLKGRWEMSPERREVIKIFQVVTLGEKLLCEDIAKLLKKEITLNPEEPNVYFTVTEQSEDPIVSGT